MFGEFGSRFMFHDVSNPLEQMENTLPHVNISPRFYLPNFCHVFTVPRQPLECLQRVPSFPRLLSHEIGVHQFLFLFIYFSVFSPDG